MQQSHRIEIADVLRGFAIMGIFLIHTIEHFNFYSFPKAPNEFIEFTDKAIWEGLFFALAGKAYAIFAMLFGFSFFIQDSRQTEQGKDFRARFAWRLVLLFVIGNLDAAFFTAEVLVLYSLVGFAMLPVCRLSNRTVLIIAIILMLQPIEIYKIIYSLANPDYVAGPSLDAPYWAVTYEAQTNGNFWQMLKVNMWEGQIASLGWAWENGRVFQTASLFLIGMLVGRTQFLKGGPEYLKLNVRLIIISILVFFPLYGLHNMLPSFIENQSLLKPLLLILSSLHKFAFMVFLVNTIMWGYYNTTKFKKWLVKLVPYGKMSLTNYVMQSIIGSLIFYGWGFGLHKELGVTYSFLLGVALFLLQYNFCVWWMRHHKQGILEYLWKRATWLK